MVYFSMLLTDRVLLASLSALHWNNRMLTHFRFHPYYTILLFKNIILFYYTIYYYTILYNSFSYNRTYTRHAFFLHHRPQNLGKKKAEMQKKSRKCLSIWKFMSEKGKNGKKKAYYNFDESSWLAILFSSYFSIYFFFSLF